MNRFLIVVPIIGPTVNDLARQCSSAVDQGADILEFRLDCFNTEALHQYQYFYPRKKRIVTNRHHLHAGKNSQFGWKGTEEQRFQMLLEAVNLNLDYVDVESDYLQQLYREESPTKIIGSYHNWEETPHFDGLVTIYEDIIKKRADIVKITTMAQTPHDGSMMLRFIECYAHKFPLIGIAMGEYGTG